MPRVRKIATPAPATSSTVVISNDGDILIQIRDPSTGVEHYYRCSRDVLRGVSGYFNVLLDPIKFSEGIAVEARLKDLRRQYYNFALVPTSELPTAIVSDVGDLPKGYMSTGIVVRLFLEILHDPSTAWPVLRAESITLIALLSIVADRFACLDTIKEYLIRQGLDTTLLKERKIATAHKIELENRQRLLAGLLFGFPDLVRRCSAALIVGGQQATSLDNGEDNDWERDDALWWSLPGGVEGAS